MTGYRLGKVEDLTVTITDSAVLSLAGLWLALSALGSWLLPLSATQAFIGGLLAVVLHVISAVAHQLGHARAARQAGYPMRGIRLWFLISTSIYPDDESPLPPAIHIQRALGGPPASLLLALAGMILLMVLDGRNDLPYWLLFFFTADNLLVFALGAFLPLPFTDGGTLLHWWRQRQHTHE